MKSRVLGCDIFEGRHTAVNIASAYEEIVTRFNIQGKVKKIVADNASSMVKAFDVSLPSFYIDQEEDAENLCNPNFVDEDEDTCLESVLSFLPQRMGCFAHSQQLCERWVCSFRGKEINYLYNTSEDCILDQLYQEINSSCSIPSIKRDCPSDTKCNKMEFAVENGEVYTKKSSRGE